MTKSTIKVQFGRREVLLVEGERTDAGHQVYEVDGQHCFASCVIGLMDQRGDPVPGLGTQVIFCPVQQVPAK